MRIREPEAKRSVLDISVAGLARIERPVDMLLKNNTNDEIHRLCGRQPSEYERRNRGGDLDEMKWIRFSPRDVRNGIFKYGCPISLIPCSQPLIDTRFVERSGG